MRPVVSVARLLLWAHRKMALYRDTRYLLLAQLEGRKSGRVTVGESRLPAGMVLVMIRANQPDGVTEAATMWPQLTGEELDVLGQLADDIGVEERPEPDVLRDDLVDTFLGWSGSAVQAADRVMTVLAEHGVIRDGRDG